jgi:hypothetical protein
VGALLLLAIPNFMDSNYAHAYGYASDSGISFQRFFKKHCIEWDDVARISWNNSNLFQRPYVVISLEHRVGCFRSVKFFVNDKTYRWGQPPSEDWVPEILPWLMNQLRMNQPPRR